MKASSVLTVIVTERRSFKPSIFPGFFIVLFIRIYLFQLHINTYLHLIITLHALYSKIIKSRLFTAGVTNEVVMTVELKPTFKTIITITKA